MGRRGTKEYRPPEALALISADRDHEPLFCPSCRTRTIERVPRRRNGGRVTPRSSVELNAERISLTCRTCGRHAYYVWAQIEQIQVTERY